MGYPALCPGVPETKKNKKNKSFLFRKSETFFACLKTPTKTPLTPQNDNFYLESLKHLRVWKNPQKPHWLHKIIISISKASNLLCMFYDLFEVVFGVDALYSGQHFAPIPLLNTDMDGILNARPTSDVIVFGIGKRIGHLISSSWRNKTIIKNYSITFTHTHTHTHTNKKHTHTQRKHTHTHTHTQRKHTEQFMYANNFRMTFKQRLFLTGEEGHY